MVFVSFLKMCTILVINMNEGHLRMFLLQVDIDPDCHRLLVKNAIDIESMKLRGEKVALIISSFAEVILVFFLATIFLQKLYRFLVLFSSSSSEVMFCNSHNSSLVLRDRLADIALSH